MNRSVILTIQEHMSSFLCKESGRHDFGTKCLSAQCVKVLSVLNLLNGRGVI